MEQKRNNYMNEGFSDFPSYVERSSPKPKLLLTFIIVLLLIVAALAGLYFLGSNSKKELVQSIPLVPTPTAGAVSNPTTAPTQPTLERSALTVAILNGSGTAGAARGVSSTLNGLGYTIGTIGNAKRFDYQGITIHVNKKNSAYLSLLEKDLKDANPKASISASIDTITGNAEVIVGK